MTISKRKMIYAALLSAFGGLGAVGTASAVQVNPAGIGQALIYPYYTVRTAGRGAYNTYLSVVNTTVSTKAVKVRFREGKNSKPVLDFNLYLSPFDVWAAAVVPASESDPTAGAKLITADTSCTTPAYKGNESAFVFSNAAFTNADGTSTDGETTSIDRTSEGHFEIIEMGDVTGTITTGLVHRNGVPVNCGVLGVLTTSDTRVRGASGGLTGSGMLINVNNGTAFSYNAVALDDFATGVNLWSKPGSTLPDLGSASPRVSVVLTREGMVTSDWSNSPVSADPVSAVLMHDNLINEFVLDTATFSGTDWVMTFPTKYAYVANDVVIGQKRVNSAAQRPFQQNFWTGGACDAIVVTPFDREGKGITLDVVVGLPPPPPPPVSLCWAANVMTFENSFGVPSDLLGSRNRVLAASRRWVSGEVISKWGFQNGWANVSFFGVSAYPTAHRISAPLGASTRLNSRGEIVRDDGVYFGLPAVGFMVQDFINGNLQVGGTSTLSNYGGLFEHKSTNYVPVSR